MPDKVIYVKTLEKPKDKNGKPYIKLTDQDLQYWSIFDQDFNFEVGKMYLLTFHNNERGFPVIEKITPLVNIFKQEAIRQTANINDIKRDLGIAMRYAVDLAVGDKIPSDKIYSQADEIYEFINKRANELMPKEVK